MKTAKEIAKKMAKGCADKLWEVGEGHKEAHMKEAPAFIDDQLALRQLIEVARAADAVNMSFGPIIKTQTHLKLNEALVALEATGKADWL